MSFNTPWKSPSNPKTCAWSRLVLASLLVVSASWPLAGQANPSSPVPVDSSASLQALQGLSQVGKGVLRVFGFQVYQARLLAQNPAGLKPDQSPYGQRFALSLTYSRKIRGQDIGETSREEMARLHEGPLPAAWLTTLSRLFPDVKAGDEIIGLYSPGQGVTFLLNGAVLGQVADPAFAQTFFDIWLSPKTRKPDLRAALLGLER